jgi:hypothetical protein
MPNYRKLYESVFGEIPKDNQNRSYEIHHIDGNHNNNSIENLMCVSIEEHYNIHYSQGDFNAANLIAMRFNTAYVKGYKRPLSEETKVKLRKPKLNKENYKKPKTEAHKETIRLARIGTKRSDDTKSKMSIKKLGKTPIQNLTQIICPFCKKEGQQIAMKRWHFNNCKEREVNHA